MDKLVFLLTLLLIGCTYSPHTHRIFWYCGNHEEAHLTLNESGATTREKVSKKYGCKNWRKYTVEVR